MPRALKLTVIAALKIITKQQEAADVLGQCTAVKDTLVRSEIYSGGQRPGRSQNKGLMLPSKLDFISHCLNFNIWGVHPFAAATAARLSGSMSDCCSVSSQRISSEYSADLVSLLIYEFKNIVLNIPKRCNNL